MPSLSTLPILPHALGLRADINLGELYYDSAHAPWEMDFLRGDWPTVMICGVELAPEVRRGTAFKTIPRHPNFFEAVRITSVVLRDAVEMLFSKSTKIKVLYFR